MLAGREVVSGGEGDKGMFQLGMGAKENNKVIS
jgi:hypothetical protein